MQQLFQMEKKLYRSRSNAIIAGVCGGIAEFFGINAALVRLLFIFTGVGVFIYLLLWAFIPDNPKEAHIKRTHLLFKLIIILILIPFVWGFIRYFIKNFLGY